MTVVVRPRSLEAWRAFVLQHAGPQLIEFMAAELRAQGTTVRPWEILRELVERPAGSMSLERADEGADDFAALEDESCR